MSDYTEITGLRRNQDGTIDRVTVLQRMGYGTYFGGQSRLHGPTRYEELRGWESDLAAVYETDGGVEILIQLDDWQDRGKATAWLCGRDRARGYSTSHGGIGLAYNDSDLEAVGKATGMDPSSWGDDDCSDFEASWFEGYDYHRMHNDRFTE